MKCMQPPQVGFNSYCFITVHKLNTIFLQLTVDLEPTQIWRAGHVFLGGSRQTPP